MLSLLLGLLALTSQTWAFFRLSCSAVSIERIDPIVNPGEVSPHLHSIAGSSLFSATSDYDTLTGGGADSCTSCGAVDDHSNYWSNNIAFRWANNSVSFLRNDEIAVYYEFSSDPQANAALVAFPKGFQMLAGDPKGKTANQAVNYKCLRATGDYAPAVDSKTLPVGDCPGGIRLELQFPSCGTGDATSSDHKSHVTYPDAAGQCPEDFPEHYPAIKLETVFASEEFSNLWDQAADPQQPFVLSTGDTVGHTAHADFMMGWKDDSLQEALGSCLLGGMDEGAFDPAYCLKVDTTPCFKTPSVNELIMSGPGQSSPPLDYLPGVEGTTDAEFCPNVQTMTSAEGNIWASCAGGSRSSRPPSQPAESPRMTGQTEDEDASSIIAVPLKPTPEKIEPTTDVLPSKSVLPNTASLPVAVPQATETGRGGWRGRENYGNGRDQENSQNYNQYTQQDEDDDDDVNYHKAAVVQEDGSSATESEYTVSDTTLVSSASKLLGRHLLFLGALAVFCVC